jgi:RNA polymerase sigma-70 factor (ECF subfamily)
MDALDKITTQVAILRAERSFAPLLARLKNARKAFFNRLTVRIDMDLAPFINLYRAPLVGLIASWGAPWADAAEIAEESFAEAWLKRAACQGDVDESEAFGRWLRGVARNRYRNWVRGRRRSRLRLVTLTPAVVENAAAPSEPEPSERLEALRRAIGRLPARQRQVVMMHYLEETSIRETAALLSLPEKTVEGRLYQARRALARMLGPKISGSQIGTMLLCL